MSESKCPFPHEQIKAAKPVATGESAKSWWPNKVSLDALTHNNPKSNPLDENFDYAKEFASLHLDGVKDFIRKIMKSDHSIIGGGPDAMPYGQEYWWPADWNHYGPLFIRLAWHSAGTYRVSDGRGGAGQGMIRLAPLNSWPDNANLDKARRILWTVKERFGAKLSWADLIILAGNVALEDMGLKTFGFAGGREDAWEADNTYWGSETAWLANERHREQTILENPLAATHMGLIYVNPEGPNGDAEDFAGSARDIRITFARMAMNDEETVALIAGGHAFGKAHGNGDPSKIGPEPEGATIQSAGLGWQNTEGKGHSEDTFTSGLEGAWTPTPLKWDNKYLELLYKYEWQKVLSPGGAQQWEPIDCEPEDMVVDAHVPGKMNKPMMLTTDLALRFGDESYNEICQKFLNDFEYFSDVFAKAWFKLTHRDMGPRTRYVGSEVPSEVLLWQDPLDENLLPELTEKDKANLRGNLLQALENTDIEIEYSRADHIDTRKLDIRDLIFTAWVSASTYRATDKRGGANGARILLEPMKSWEFVDFERVEKVVEFLESVRNGLNLQISMADLIVFAGNFGIERGIKNAGYEAEVPFTGGRVDARQEQIDIESFGHLEPVHDGFLNWSKVGLPNNLVEDDKELVDFNIEVYRTDEYALLEEFSEYLFIERSALLSLTPPEMTALFVGFRSMSVHHRTSRVSSVSWNRNSGHKLNSDFLENLVLKPWYRWEPSLHYKDGMPAQFDEEYHPPKTFDGKHYFFGDESSNLYASRIDLLFASNSILRSIAEVYCGEGGNEILIKNFIKAWVKIMNADRFDIK